MTPPIENLLKIGRLTMVIFSGLSVVEAEE